MYTIDTFEYPYSLCYKDGNMLITFQDIALTLNLEGITMNLSVVSCADTVSEVELYKHLYFAEKNKELFTIEDRGAQGVGCIHIKKRTYVDALLKELNKKQYSFIQGIIVFGSCITHKCTDKSDIDLIYVMEQSDILDKGDLLLDLYRACYDVLQTNVDTLYVDSFDEFYKGASTLHSCLLRDNSYRVVYRRS